MGALHKGHLALMEAAARENRDVVVSVFVNPAQFGVGEDLESYPVTWERDAAVLAKTDGELEAGGSAGRIAAVFAPDTGVMYPEGEPGREQGSTGTFVTVTPLATMLEGQSRPTFFRGVATVCTKLFNIIAPRRVYLGQKDVQQTVVLRRMVRDLMMPIDIVVCPTVRDEDGLALSSRNVYLGPRRRRLAVAALTSALRAASEAYEAGAGTREGILGPAHGVVSSVKEKQAALAADESSDFVVQYLSLADPDTLDEVEVVDGDRGAVLSGAMILPRLRRVAKGEDVGYAGGPSVRLIDNIILKPRSSY